MDAELTLAYFAGLFDGEGCVAPRNIWRAKTSGRHDAGRKLRSVYVRVAISMTDTIALWDLQRQFGGNVYRERRNNPNPKHLIDYIWVIGSQKACAFLRSIRPYTRIKTAQIDVALALQDRIDRWIAQPCRRRAMTEEEHAARLELVERLHALKKIKVHGAVEANGAKTGNPAIGNPVLTRRESLKRVSTVDPSQPFSMNGRHETVSAN